MSADPEWLWERLRSLGPPAGARERVLRRIEARTRARRPLRWLALAALPAAAALLVVRLRRVEPVTAPPPSALAATVPAPALAPAAAARAAARGPLQLDGR